MPVFLGVDGVTDPGLRVFEHGDEAPPLDRRERGHARQFQDGIFSETLLPRKPFFASPLLG
jgi:hypothetical protein